jgi:hypothetical protein
MSLSTIWHRRVAMQVHRLEYGHWRIVAFAVINTSTNVRSSCSGGTLFGRDVWYFACDVIKCILEPNTEVEFVAWYIDDDRTSVWEYPHDIECVICNRLLHTQRMNSESPV